MVVIAGIAVGTPDFYFNSQGRPVTAWVCVLVLLMAVLLLIRRHA